MQQTWHIYSQRPQNSETGINFFILFSTVPFRAPQKRRFLGTYSGHRALTSRYFLRATSVKLVHVLNKNFCLKGFPISWSIRRSLPAENGHIFRFFYFLRGELVGLSYCMHQRANFSGARQFIREHLLLQSFFCIINPKRVKELVL
jgi:hypothetical protein